MKLKNLNAKKIQLLLTSLTNDFSDCSVINKDGTLLYSKDITKSYMTTSRLVAFQIIKKYLNPKPLDLFILNDPENGGFNYQQIIFVTALSEEIFIVWSRFSNIIDFKIPPTPLFEKNKANEFVWSALVNPHPQSKDLANFFESEKQLIDELLYFKEVIQQMSLVKNQNIWLKATENIFHHQYQNKAYGTSEIAFKTPQNQLIKLVFSSSENLSVTPITIDFTQTSLAQDFFAASHVVESAIVNKLTYFYGIEGYLTQVVLDKIKLILPPKSIVSKAHPSGMYNEEIQLLIQQLLQHNLNCLNLKSRQTPPAFQIDGQFKAHFKNENHFYPLLIDQRMLQFLDLERMVLKGLFKIKTLNRNEQVSQIELEYSSDQSSEFCITSDLFLNFSNQTILINKNKVQQRNTLLKKGDFLEISWKTT